MNGDGEVRLVDGTPLADWLRECAANPPTFGRTDDRVGIEARMQRVDREELCRILHDANTGKICPDPGDPTRYRAMAEAVLERIGGRLPAVRASS